MKVIFGSAGFAKEVDWLMYENASKLKNEHAIDYFVGKENAGSFINQTPIISDLEFASLLKLEMNFEGYYAMGDPILRNKIYEIYSIYKNINYPNLIHHNVMMDRRINMIEIGIGNIICAGSILTTNIKLGNFIHINLNCTIGHDTQIDDFCTISPGCNISGNVKIGKNVFLGTNSIVLEHVSIESNTIIGAGSVVTKSIFEPGTYVGVPAKKIK